LHRKPTCLLLDPGNILVRGCRIDDHTIPVILHEIDDKIIDHAAILPEHAGIQCLARLFQPGYIIRQKLAQESLAIVTPQIDDHHMTNIEHTGILTYRMMLFDL